MYLDGFDHFCKELLRAKGYLRYVDDFVLFADDPGRLVDWWRRIDRYLEGRRLRLHPRKTHIGETSAPASFLGYVLLPGGRRRLPEDNVRRFRNRLRGLRDRWRQGTATRAEIEQRIQSWIAHADHADTWRLRHSIFRAGWFDPAREPGHPPAVGSSAAVPGTTIRRTSAPRTGTGTPRPGVAMMITPERVPLAPPRGGRTRLQSEATHLLILPPVSRYVAADSVSATTPARGQLMKG
ncbi:RNA-directed DNA polymerase [Candidatus Palauibacter sp.]|uniref:RNA-directed DNA polymerase n=1 Tax=Candidatus Palauibacter sp. TaxID=3101350 RepID=UPI003B015709